MRGRSRGTIRPAAPEGEPWQRLHPLQAPDRCRSGGHRRGRPSISGKRRPDDHLLRTLTWRNSVRRSGPSSRPRTSGFRRRRDRLTPRRRPGTTRYPTRAMRSALLCDEPDFRTPASAIEGRAQVVNAGQPDLAEVWLEGPCGSRREDVLHPVKRDRDGAACGIHNAKPLRPAHESAARSWSVDIEQESGDATLLWIQTNPRSR